MWRAPIGMSDVAVGHNKFMATQNTPTDHVIFPSEAEAYVQELQPFNISDIGSERWSLQRERLEQLNMQAVFNVTHQGDEFVKEFLSTHNKIPVLVHELLTVEIWKEKVFPLMMEMCEHPRTSFPTYLVLYHEGTVVSLLETALYYCESCESAEDCILDLVDYCQRRITGLLMENEGGGVEEMGDSDDSENTPSRKYVVKELKEQQKSLSFGIAMKSLSLLRYITDHLAVFPLSVMTRLLNTHDTPCLLVGLVESAPWSKTGGKGQLLKYNEGEWREMDRLKLTKTEGQVWLTLYQLLMSQDCQKKYQFNLHNKNTILKLRTYLSEPLLDQIPNLGDLQRYLEHLSFMDPPVASRELILEQVPVIYEKLMKDNSGRWASIAKKHAKRLFEPSPEEIKAQAKRWVDTYNLDVLETLVAGPPKCALCGSEATKRCSRCQNEWYCGRECQVKHWKKHKVSCDVIAGTS